MPVLRSVQDERGITNMAVNHVVFFKFKEKAKLEEIDQHMKMFQQLSKTISGIIDYSAGKTFKVGYEPTADYDCMHCVTFESEKTLEKYYFHEKHREFINKNKHMWDDVLVLNSYIELYK